jgi:uncharacterized protein (DUF2147 family)
MAALSGWRLEMKKLIAVAVLALVSTTAQAKVHELKFGGRTARIEIPAGCKKISCIRVKEKEKTSRSRRSSEPAAAAPAAPVAPPTAPAAAAAATAAVAPQAAAAPDAAPAVAKPEPQAHAPEAADDRRPVARLSLPSAAVEEVKPAAAPAAAPAPAAEPAKSSGSSPIGLWLTQKKEAKIRVVECGANICGHVEGKPNDKVLINMKPTGGNRWNGTIQDIRRGGKYSAHISLKGPDALRVTGCAFGGMFCGGETWSRVE